MGIGPAVPASFSCPIWGWWYSAAGLRDLSQALTIQLREYDFKLLSQGLLPLREVQKGTERWPEWCVFHKTYVKMEGK